MKLLILDFDGTLADTRELIIRTNQEAQRRMHYPVCDEATIVPTIGIPLREGILQMYPGLPEEDLPVIDAANSLAERMEKAMNEIHPHIALSEIWKLIGLCNKYIDVTAPWVLAKDEAKKPRLGTVLYNLAEALRIIAVALQPFMPNTSPKMFEQLGVPEGELREYESIKRFGSIKPGTAVNKGEALFPRIDAKAEMEFLDAMIEEQRKKAAAMKAAEASAESAAESAAEAPAEPSAEPAAEKPAEPSAEPAGEPSKPLITYDDFAKLDLRVGKVIDCVEVKKSKHLYNITLEVGAEKRTVLSGIKDWVAPSDIIGKNVVLVYNLAPRKMCGIESCGMILAASTPGDADVVPLTTLKDIPSGSLIR